MKIGSLFDGSGGFPLAASLCGIAPAFASEIEPYPIAVTTSRFPNMRHLGDISKINGAEIEPVHIITFGSPCQDLSVAGKQKGLKHEANGDDETTRSGLFMEAVRIIKEMREATNGKYPRYAIWENVPGAFGSNKSRDFQIVLEEIIKISEPTAPEVPMPEKGRWPYADIVMGDGWSIAYRTLDAQYWGVPQRRRRIYLVADFGGGSAGEILFKREGLRGYFEEGRTPWQRIADHLANRAGADNQEREGSASRSASESGVASTIYASYGTKWNGNAGAYNGENFVLEPTVAIEGNGSRPSHMGDGYIESDKMYTLNTIDRHAVCYCIGAYNSEGMKSDNPHSGIYETDTARTLDLNGGNPACNQGGIAVVEKVVYDARGNGDGKIAPTITGDHNGHISDYTAVVCIPEPYQKVTGPLMANTHPGSYSGQDAYTDMLVVCKSVAYGLDRAAFNQGKNALFSFTVSRELQPTLTAKGPGAVSYSMKSIARNGAPLEEQANPICASDYKDPDIVAVPAKPHYVVRRLTPTECARLQGFPDTWGHPIHKESLTDEEYAFWLNVRNTHADINGKTVKHYTKKQMLTWYNKLHTDSAEYKLWGNGIALPTALYVLQGIAEELRKTESTHKDPIKHP